MKSFPSQVLALLAIVLGWQLAPTEVRAQWSTDSHVNNPICTTTTRQQAPRIASDGTGGAIITWWDLDLNTSDYNIYAQKIGSDGMTKWTTNGVAICTNALLQQAPEITSDGNGGAIIAWQDNRSGQADIYAQRIDSDGTVHWTGDGIPVCNANSDQTFPQLISDDSGGAIISWQDLRGGSNYVPYAQRLDSGGAIQWTGNGVLLSATGTAETPQMVSDGQGGAILTWHQYVSPPGQFDIYAQHITAHGDLGWDSNAVVICGLASNQLRPQIVSDGGYGAIIAWEDYRNVSYSNLYAQHVDSGGVAQWTTNGVALAPNTIHQIRHKLLNDGGGGTLVTWQYGTNEIYAQRLDAAGLRQWASDGVVIGGAGDSRFPQIATDGGTGAIITWYDYRGSGNGDIFAQRVNSAGTVQWKANGVDVCRDGSGQVFPKLVADGSGGTVIVWEDDRNSVTNSADIYAQWVSASGTLGVATAVNEHDRTLPGAFTLEQNYPNPFNPSTIISYQVPTQSFVTLKVFNVLGQEVATLVNKMEAPGRKTVTFAARNIASGVYYYRLQARSLDGNGAADYSETRKLVLIR